MNHYEPNLPRGWLAAAAVGVSVLNLTLLVLVPAGLDRVDPLAREQWTARAPAMAIGDLKYGCVSGDAKPDASGS
jgi:hypothetical protein